MPRTFSEIELHIHKICRDRGEMDVNAFAALSDDAQTDLLAYEIYRQARFSDLLEQMSKKRPLSKKTPTETSSLTPEVLAILMAAML